MPARFQIGGRRRAPSLPVAWVTSDGQAPDVARRREIADGIQTWSDRIRGMLGPIDIGGVIIATAPLKAAVALRTPDGLGRELRQQSSFPSDPPVWTAPMDNGHCRGELDDTVGDGAAACYFTPPGSTTPGSGLVVLQTRIARALIDPDHVSHVSAVGTLTHEMGHAWAEARDLDDIAPPPGRGGRARLTRAGWQPGRRAAHEYMAVRAECAVQRQIFGQAPAEPRIADLAADTGQAMVILAHGPDTPDAREADIARRASAHLGYTLGTLNALTDADLPVHEPGDFPRLRSSGEAVRSALPAGTAARRVLDRSGGSLRDLYRTLSTGRHPDADFHRVARDQAEAVAFAMARDPGADPRTVSTRRFPGLRRKQQPVRDSCPEPDGRG